ncbi:MAG: hypothetical protein WAV11_03185 [Minisyncoccia bacterium]
MKKVFWIVGILVLIVLVVLVFRGCHKKKITVESVKTDISTSVKIIQQAPEEAPDMTQDLFLVPEPVSGFSDLVIANNIKDLNLRAWIYVNGEQEFASDVYKSQSNSRTKKILIGSEVKVKAIAEDTEGRSIAKGEITFIIEEVRIVVSVASLGKGKLTLSPEKK